MGNPPPPVLDLLIDVVDEFKAHFVDRLLAGLGILLVSMVCTGTGFVLAYIPLVAAGVVGALLDDEVVLIALTLVGAFVGLTLLFVLATLPLAPLQGSLGRAVLRSLEDGSDLGIAAPFETMGQDAWKLVVLLTVQLGLVIGGLMMCYVPGLLVGFLTGLALPAVIVHRLGPIAALRRSAEHALEEPIWHLGYYAVTFGISLVFPYLPVIGIALLYPFLLSFQLRAYVAIFGRD